MRYSITIELKVIYKLVLHVDRVKGDDLEDSRKKYLRNCWDDHIYESQVHDNL